MRKPEKNFVAKLLDWNKNSNRREMPWKGEKDPYKIWLSEIILQQTRVDQGLQYYHNFITAFPTIQALASADETVVFKLWEGLGYYTRCKNLIATAKTIVHSFDGHFPTTYPEILALKGIGPYTAAAIGSFAFKLPHAVIDGNVYRVLSRYFGISSPIDSRLGKELFFQLANRLLDKNEPGSYNQAIMDFGAVICKPQLPLCGDCMLQSACKAFQDATVDLLPMKEKSISRRSRWFYYFVFEFNDELYVGKRGAKDIWENLYEFFPIESDKPLTTEEAEALIHQSDFIENGQYELLNTSKIYKQLLTHQTVFGQFFHIKLSNPVTIDGYFLASKTTIQQLPFPKFTSNYLKDKNVSLNSFPTEKNQHSEALITTI